MLFVSALFDDLINKDDKKILLYPVSFHGSLVFLHLGAFYLIVSMFCQC